MIQRFLSESEEEKAQVEQKKLKKEAVLYMTPEQLDKSGESGKGARCGKCMFFNAEKSECLITAPAHCNAKHGVCGLFVGGKSIFAAGDEPTLNVSKATAGYIEDEKNVPTRCGNCHYFLRSEGLCRKVKGTIEADACCNKWGGPK